MASFGHLKRSHSGHCQAKVMPCFFDIKALFVENKFCVALNVYFLVYLESFCYGDFAVLWDTLTSRFVKRRCDSNLATASRFWFNQRIVLSFRVCIKCMLRGSNKCLCKRLPFLTYHVCGAKYEHEAVYFSYRSFCSIICWVVQQAIPSTTPHFYFSHLVCHKNVIFRKNEALLNTKQDDAHYTGALYYTVSFCKPVSFRIQ